MRPTEHSGNAFPVLKWILITTFSCYVLQSIFIWWFRSGWMGYLFALSHQSISSGYLWTLLTYAFLHSPANPFHVIFNMLVLFLAGRLVQAELGPGRLLSVYVMSILFGAFVWLPFNPNAYLIGASAGVMGVFMMFLLRHRDEEMTFLLFFIIPIRLKARVLLYGIIGFELFGFLFLELPGSSQNVAFSAHLGGILGAVIYNRFLLQRDTLFRFTRRASRTQTVNPWRSRKAVSGSRFSVNIESRDHFRKEIDRILDKINSKGFGSLSEDEKRILDRARDQLNR